MSMLLSIGPTYPTPTFYFVVSETMLRDYLDLWKKVT